MPKLNHAGKQDRITVRITKRQRRMLRLVARRGHQSEAEFVRALVAARLAEEALRIEPLRLGEGRI